MTTTNTNVLFAFEDILKTKVNSLSRSSSFFCLFLMKQKESANFSCYDLLLVVTLLEPFEMKLFFFPFFLIFLSFVPTSQKGLTECLE